MDSESVLLTQSQYFLLRFDDKFVVQIDWNEDLSQTEAGILFSLNSVSQCEYYYSLVAHTQPYWTRYRTKLNIVWHKVKLKSSCCGMWWCLKIFLNSRTAAALMWRFSVLAHSDWVARSLMGIQHWLAHALQRTDSRKILASLYFLWNKTPDLISCIPNILE